MPVGLGLHDRTACPGTWCQARALGVMDVPWATRSFWRRRLCKLPGAGRKKYLRLCLILPRRFKSSLEVVPEGTVRLSPTYPIPRLGEDFLGRGWCSCAHLRIPANLPSELQGKQPPCVPAVPCLQPPWSLTAPGHAEPERGRGANNHAPSRLFILCWGKGFFSYIFLLQTCDECVTQP